MSVMLGSFHSFELIKYQIEGTMQNQDNSYQTCELSLIVGETELCYYVF